MHVYTTYSYRDNYGVANSESCPGNSAMTSSHDQRLEPCSLHSDFILTFVLQQFIELHTNTSQRVGRLSM